MKVKEILQSIYQGFYDFGKGFSMCTMYPNFDYRVMSDKEALNSDAMRLAEDGRIAMSRFERELKKGL